MTLTLHFAAIVGKIVPGERLRQPSLSNVAYRADAGSWHHSYYIFPPPLHWCCHPRGLRGPASMFREAGSSAALFARANLGACFVQGKTAFYKDCWT